MVSPAIFSLILISPIISHYLNASLIHTCSACDPYYWEMVLFLGDPDVAIRSAILMPGCLVYNAHGDFSRTEQITIGTLGLSLATDRNASVRNILLLQNGFTASLFKPSTRACALVLDFDNGVIRISKPYYSMESVLRYMRPHSIIPFQKMCFFQ